MISEEGFQLNFLEIVHQRRSERVLEAQSEILVCRMPEVRREPLGIVEIDHHEVVRCVGHPRLVAGAVDDALTDADASDRRNLTEGPFEGRDQSLAVRSRQVGSRLHQREVRDHACCQVVRQVVH
jgi:hypothetical protein